MSKRSTVEREPLVDNKAYLCFLDKAYSSTKERKKVDREKIDAIKVSVKITESKKSKMKVPNVIKTKDMITLTEDSWGKCLDYYETCVDALTTPQVNLSKLVELEFWFIFLIEPVDHSNIGKWHEKENNKMIQCHSNYLPLQYRQIVSFKLKTMLSHELVKYMNDSVNYVLKYHGFI